MFYPCFLTYPMQVDEEVIVVKTDEGLDEDVHDDDSEDRAAEDVQVVHSTKRPIDTDKKGKQKKKKLDTDDLLEEAIVCLRKEDRSQTDMMYLVNLLCQN